MNSRFIFKFWDCWIGRNEEFGLFWKDDDVVDVGSGCKWHEFWVEKFEEPKDCFVEAKKFVIEAIKNGADIIKFQVYTPDTITINCKKKDFLVKSKNSWKKYIKNIKKTNIAELKTFTYWDENTAGTIIKKINGLVIPPVI